MTTHHPHAAPPAQAPAPRGRATGFSLVELVLATVIIAAVAAMAMPRYASALSRFESAAAARRVVAEIDRARQHARAASRPVTLRFDVGADTVTTPNLAGLGGSAAAPVDLAATPYHTQLTAADFGGTPDLTFDGFGQPHSSGTVTLTRGDLTRVVTVDARGKAASP